MGGTFFVSHKYTNYSAVQELHRKGHEIGVFSITNNERARYWTEGSYDSWLGEMAGARLIIERFANISGGGPNPIIGVRAPLLRVGGNTQFEMMYDQGFFYDSSTAAPLSRVPVWPYSLDFRMPHKCHGNAQNCPSRSWRGLWEMPINELDRRDDPSFDERLSGCHLVSSCSNIYDKEQFGRMIRHNFERHYLSNRAPLSLSFDAAWLKTNKGFTQVLVDWMTETLEEHNDVYFLTEYQVIQWVQGPTLLLSAQRLSSYYSRTSRRDTATAHLRRMPEQLPLADRPHWRRIQLLGQPLTAAKSSGKQIKRRAFQSSSAQATSLS